MNVRVDPGHGGPDPGAVGNGVREAECVLEISKLVAAMLRIHGVGVQLTRIDDTGQTSAERARKVALASVECVVSIHANAAASAAANGYEVFVSAYNAESRRLGECLAREYNAAVTTVGPRRPAVKTRVTRTNQDYYYIVRHPTNAGLPAVLFECAFVSNPADAEVLAGFWGRFAMAYGIARGILRWLGII